MSNETIALRLVCHLPSGELSENELAYFATNEKMKPAGWVDADRPRDDAWTMVVAGRADKYGVADEDGVLAEFPTFTEAYHAIHKASSEIATVLGGLKSKVRRTTMDSISGEIQAS